MASRKVLMGAIPMIVSAIASGANVRVVWGNFQTASTNGAVIKMPYLPLEDDAVEDYALGYAVHETGHVVGTDFTVPRKPGLACSLAGILEDVRTEGERMRTLPGARRWLERLAYRLLKDGRLAKFDADLPIEDKLVCYLLTFLWLAILDFKGLSDAASKCRDNLAASLPQDVFDALEATALKVRHATDTAEVVALADELMQVLQDKQQDYEQQAQQPQAGGEQPQEPQDDQQEQQGSSGGQQDSDAGQQPQAGQQDEDEDGGGASDREAEDSDDDDQAQPQGGAGGKDGGSDESKDDAQPAGGKKPDGDADSDEDDAGGSGAGDDTSDANDDSAQAQGGDSNASGDAGDQQHGDSSGDDQSQGGAQAQACDDDGDANGNGAGGESRPGEPQPGDPQADGQPKDPAQAGQDGTTSQDAPQMDPAKVAQALRQLAEAGEAAQGKDVSERIAEGLNQTLREAGQKGSAGFTSAPDVFDLVGVLGSPSLISDVRAQSTAIRARLDEYVQAHTQSRNCQSLSGRRMSRDAGLRLVRGDMRVYDKPRVQAQKIDIAFDVMLDLSISMRGRKVQVARQAAMAVAVALEQITGVQLAISAFGGPFGTVTRVMRFGEDLRRTAGRFNQLEAANSTPLAEGLMVAHADLLALDVARRVALVVTDGQPNDGDAVMQMVALGEKLGIEHLAIGIGSDATPAQYFALSRNIAEVSELPTALLAMVRDQMFDNRLAA